MKKFSFYFLILSALLLGITSCEKKEPVITGDISGTIISSQTGEGIANITVGLTKDASVSRAADAKYKATTDFYGDFMIENVPVGTYICLVDGLGFFTGSFNGIEIIEGENELPDQTIVEQPEVGSIRIVLSWGASPSDLDSHITGPLSTSTDRFHVYYSWEYSSDYLVDLDVDDTYSYGPETITIHTLVNGTYRYSVHNYSDQTSTGGSGIATSPAKVNVYDSNGLIRSFTAPAFTGSGNTWRVFDMVVSNSTATINAVNTYVLASDDDDMTTFRSTDGKHANYILDEL